jgi:hypothetical protein
MRVEMMRHVGLLKRINSRMGLMGKARGESYSRNEILTLGWLLEDCDVNMWADFHVFAILTG